MKADFSGLKNEDTVRGFHSALEEYGYTIDVDTVRDYLLRILAGEKPTNMGGPGMFIAGWVEKLKESADSR